MRGVTNALPAGGSGLKCILSINEKGLSGELVYQVEQPMIIGFATIYTLSSSEFPQIVIFRSRTNYATVDNQEVSIFFYNQKLTVDLGTLTNASVEIVLLG